MRVKIENIADIQSGLYLKTEPDGDVIYLQIKDFDSNGRLIFDPEPLVKDNGKLSNHLLFEGDLLFAAKGTSNFCTVYKKNMGKAVATSSFFVLRIIEPHIRPDFLCWLLNTPYILKILKSCAVGSSIPSITKSMIGNIEFETPSIVKQQLIVDTCDLQAREEELYKLISYHKKALTDKILFESIK